MKKIFLMALAAVFVCGTAMAQEQEESKKKKGGFMNALKKGVESTTGLNVSKEALFVYPTIGEWKMSMKSCIGNPATGEVKLIVNTTKLMGNAVKNTHSNLREAKVSGSKDLLTFERRAADPFYDFDIGKAVEIDFQIVFGVPAETKTLDLKFDIHGIDGGFEARDVPVSWQAAE